MALVSLPHDDERAVVGLACELNPLVSLCGSTGVRLDLVAMSECVCPRVSRSTADSRYVSRADYLCLSKDSRFGTTAALFPDFWGFVYN